MLKKEIEAFIQSFDNQPQLSFLDVGCGGQPFRKLIEKYHVYQGLDYKAQVNDGSVIEMGIDDEIIHEDLAAYDVILCTEVMEHVFNPFQAYKNLSALLKSGGRILITTPFIYPLHETPHDYWRLTPYALDRLGEYVGLKQLEQKELGNAFDVLGTILGTINYLQPLKGSCNAVFSKVINRVKEYLFYWLLKKGRNDWKPFSNIYISNFIVYTK